MLSHTMPGLVKFLAEELEKNAELCQPHKNVFHSFFVHPGPSQLFLVACHVDMLTMANIVL